MKVKPLFLLFLLWSGFSLAQTDSTCACDLKFQSPGNFIPALSDLNCNGLNGSLLDLDAKKLKGLFYSNDQVAEHNSSFDIIAYRKIELLLPNTNGIKIILNPCIKKGSQIPYYIDYDHDLNKYFPNADYKTFSKRPKDYYYMLVQMSGYNDGKYVEFMRRLKNLISGESAPTDKFIADVRKLVPEFKNLNQDFKGEQAFLEAFAQSFGRCKQCGTEHPVEWVWNTFIKKHLNQKDTMEVTKEIQSDFTQLFEKALGPFSLESFNKMIYPQIQTTVYPKKAAFVFTENILRRWDSKNKKPFADSKNSFIPASLLFDVDKIVAKNNNEKIEYYGYKNPCMGYSEISGTGIILRPDSAIVIYNSIEDIWEPYKSKERTDGSLVKFISDSLVRNMHGTILWTTNVDFPILQNEATNYINCKGNNFIINGKYILGIIHVKVTIKKKDTFETVGRNTSATFSMNDLKKSLDKSGKIKYEINVSESSNKEDAKSGIKDLIICFKFSN